MSLPLSWIDAIFRKLTLVYGRDFMGRWEGLSASDVKTDWGHELAGFDRCPEAVKWALQNLPAGKPPTVIDFRDLCRKAPMPEVQRIPVPSANPEIVAAVMQRLQAARETALEPVDHKAWAKRVIARNEAGEQLNQTTLRFAREALGISCTHQKAAA